MSKKHSSKRRHVVTLAEYADTDENQVFVFKKPEVSAVRHPSSPVVTSGGFVSWFRQLLTNFWPIVR
jgi:hypothetical protein